MAIRSPFKLLVVLLLLLCLTVNGVFAAWLYYSPVGLHSEDLPLKLANIKYGLLYITKIEVAGGSYQTATNTKTADLDMHTDLTLNNDADSTLVLDVTVYNNTDYSFYYHKTDTVAWDNDRIGFEVTGIEMEEEVPGLTYKTFQVTYAFTGNNRSNQVLSADLHFDFVVDKDSIGDIVALTAVDRFESILNNLTAADTYETLTDAMDNRSGLNKASAVTYIGNVVGANSSDSNTIKNLFGEEFLSMDLDGDGETEPITMMIKRENLDNDTNTGDSYTYSSWGRNYTVYGNEMTLYITAENLSGVASGKSVVVYAAVFTKLPGESEWTELVPLTKGTANANNYSGYSYGSADSFNTDTWESDSGQTIKQLVAANA